MKLDIDSITEAKIRHYSELLDSGVPGQENFEKLQDAALLIANAMAAKVQSEDTFKRVTGK